MATLDDAMLNAEFTFQVRPVPVPGALRPVRRVALLTLVFEKCHSGQATMLQIQVLNWAIRSADNRRRFIEYLAGIAHPGEVVVRFDPSLTRAIEFGIAESSIEPVKKVAGEDEVPQRLPLRLTAKGKQLVERLMQHPDIFVIEKNFLQAIDGKVSRTQIEAMFPKE